MKTAVFGGFEKKVYTDSGSPGSETEILVGILWSCCGGGEGAYLIPLEGYSR
jgi:hypothetical protein